jgi:hypothetical protein
VRWEDERYVRIYTRDTTTWKLLPWQSKALLLLLLRKADRAGIIDLDEDAYDGIAAITDMPRELVDAAMPELLRRGIFVISGNKLVAPKFVEAQEAAASGKLRVELHRERVKTRNESLQVVTSGNEPSRGVTPSRADPCRTDPEEDPGSAGSEPDGSGSSPRSPDGSPDTAKPFTDRTPERPAPEAPPIAPPADASPTVPAAKAGRRREADRAIALPLAGIDAPNPRKEAEEVFAVYLDERRKHVGDARAPVLDDKRRRLIVARRQTFSLEDLKLAARGAWLDDWHVTEKQNTVDQVFRDTGRVEQFMGYATAPSAPSVGPGPRRAEPSPMPFRLPKARREAIGDQS